MEEGLHLREKTVGGRIKGIHAFVHAQSVKLLAAFEDGLRDGGTDAAAFIAKQRQPADGGASQFARNVEKGRHVQRREDHRETRDHHHPRPDHLPWADRQIQLRHPVIANREDGQSCAHQIASINAAAQERADDEENDDRRDSGGRQD